MNGMEYWCIKRCRLLLMLYLDLFNADKDFFRRKISWLVRGVHGLGCCCCGKFLGG
jgi:hypothetical protein